MEFVVDTWENLEDFDLSEVEKRRRYHCRKQYGLRPRCRILERFRNREVTGPSRDNFVGSASPSPQATPLAHQTKRSSALRMKDRKARRSSSSSPGESESATLANAFGRVEVRSMSLAGTVELQLNLESVSYHVSHSSPLSSVNTHGDRDKTDPEQTFVTQIPTGLHSIAEVLVRLVMNPKTQLTHQIANKGHSPRHLADAGGPNQDVRHAALSNDGPIGRVDVAPAVGGATDLFSKHRRFKDGYHSCPSSQRATLRNSA